MHQPTEQVSAENAEKNYNAIPNWDPKFLGLQIFLELGCPVFGGLLAVISTSIWNGSTQTLIKIYNSFWVWYFWEWCFWKSSSNVLWFIFSDVTCSNGPITIAPHHETNTHIYQTGSTTRLHYFPIYLPRCSLNLLSFFR